MTEVNGIGAEISVNLVTKIFIKSGYDVDRKVNKTIKKEVVREIDIIATDNESTYYVEVKYSMQKDVFDLSRYSNTIKLIANLARENHTMPKYRK